VDTFEEEELVDLVAVNDEIGRIRTELAGTHPLIL
jgi:hypothetical protein